MSQPYLAQVQIWACNFSPRTYSYCDGQLLQIASNSALFSLIGCNYGGDCRSTMALPNLMYNNSSPGRVAMGLGNGPGLTPRKEAQALGTNSVTLGVSQIPSHNHMAFAHDSGNENPNPSNNFTGRIPNGYATTSNSNMNPAAIAHTGGGQPHNNMQPYLTLGYTICVSGLYPSRS